MSNEVRQIMLEYADRSGLALAAQSPIRYLWTDAHAVCNFLSLYQTSGDAQFRHLAIDLINQVHHVLGKHRADDTRRGWISGLSAIDGEQHPTAGGLRIGKTLNERGVNEAFDDHLEWDRDGQYFHYLTKWMHALSRAALVLDEPHYCRWAEELAQAAHTGFTTVDPFGGRKYLCWKMSIDLSRPLVLSAGMHDPLDGYITYNEILQCAERFPSAGMPSDLHKEITETEAMMEAQRWQTTDPLGIGGLLFDGCRTLQLAVMGRHCRTITLELLKAARESMTAFARHFDPEISADRRLAFRELGLAIGLHAVTRMQHMVDINSTPNIAGLRREFEALGKYAPLATTIESFWREPGNQRSRSWLDHRDINSVMLATSLLPDEFLSLNGIS